jgi:[ribosomal protein S18]-alanine N-acetyltransferase
VTDLDEPGQVIVRRMQEKDIEQVHALDVLSFTLPWPERSFRYELNENPASRQWVAEIVSGDGASKIVGMIVSWLIIDEVHIGTIAVLPEHRRQGIGLKLIVKALVEAGGSGAVQGLLEVRRGNVAAQELYRKLGFVVVGVRPHYYRDNQEDALLMTLPRIDPAELQSFL